MELDAGRIYEKLYVDDNGMNGGQAQASYLGWHFCPLPGAW
jgi:hypothetical protein